MKQDIKTKWVAALRHGTYKQGTHRLRTGNRFCCLAVLCDVIDPDGWESPVRHTLEVFSHNGSIGMPRNEVYCTAELEPTVLVTKEQLEAIGIVVNNTSNSFTLSLLNDMLGLTFDQIALVIETYL